MQLRDPSADPFKKTPSPPLELCALLSVVHAIMTIMVVWSVCREYIARDEDALVGYILATGLMVAVLWELDGSRRFL